MSYSEEERRRVFKRTDGRCHLCWRPIDLEKYGAVGDPRGWEFDHSQPRAEGGSDHPNNRYPAHPSCNRSKGSTSSRKYRKEKGYSGPPLSESRKQKKERDQKIGGALAGAGIGAAVGGPPGAVVGGLVGLLAGDAKDPEGDRKQV
jgi:hypothetical protein